MLPHIDPNTRIHAYHQFEPSLFFIGINKCAILGPKYPCRLTPISLLSKSIYPITPTITLQFRFTTVYNNYIILKETIVVFFFRLIWKNCINY
jgi:hypothetical protein